MPDEEDFQEQRKLAHLKEELAKAQAQQRLEEIKSKLDMEKSIYEEFYNSGLISYEAYLEKQASLRHTALSQEISAIETERKAALDDAKLESSFLATQLVDAKKRLKALKDSSAAALGMKPDEYSKNLEAGQKGVDLLQNRKMDQEPLAAGFHVVDDLADDRRVVVEAREQRVIGTETGDRLSNKCAAHGARGAEDGIAFGHFSLIRISASTSFHCDEQARTKAKAPGYQSGAFVELLSRNWTPPAKLILL